MSDAPVDLDVTDTVAVLTINRPEVRNAIDYATAGAIAAALDRCEDDPAIRAVIIRGEGDTAFSAGADLKSIAAGGPRPVHRAHGFAGVARYPRTKPLIAAVNGFALGGGFEIVLACDLAVAADHATFGLPEVRIGLVPSGGGLVRLSRALPPALAAELALTAKRITAEEARTFGLVNRVVPLAQLMPAARALAGDLAQGSPIAMTQVLRILRIARWAPDESSAWWASEQGAAVVRESRDAVEGARAFVERRTPRWTGD